MDKKWWTLIAVCTGTFMLLLDVTIVIVGAASALLLIRGKDFVRSGGGEPQAAPAVPGGAAGADGVSPARSA